MTPTNYLVPPPELVQQWKRTAPHPINEREHYHYITLCAAQWGADQELEACCEWLTCGGLLPRLPALTESLRAARRPKPPSLAQRALHILGTHGDLSCAEHDTIRRALEALND
jgi:hypothetical protein